LVYFFVLVEKKILRGGVVFLLGVLRISGVLWVVNRGAVVLD
jgi:hypothetical protein